MEDSLQHSQSLVVIKVKELEGWLYPLQVGLQDLKKEHVLHFLVLPNY
jgi:hypothetical protein